MPCFRDSSTNVFVARVSAELPRDIHPRPRGSSSAKQPQAQGVRETFHDLPRAQCEPLFGNCWNSGSDYFINFPQPPFFLTARRVVLRRRSVLHEYTQHCARPTHACKGAACRVYSLPLARTIPLRLGLRSLAAPSPPAVPCFLCHILATFGCTLLMRAWHGQTPDKHRVCCWCCAVRYVFDNVIRTAYTHIYLCATRNGERTQKNKCARNASPVPSSVFVVLRCVLPPSCRRLRRVHVVHERTPSLTLRFIFASVVFPGSCCRGDGSQFSATVRLQNRSPKP